MAVSVWSGKLLKVCVRNMRLPNRARVRLEIVNHPGAALIVPFLTARTVIILRQFRPVINRYIYELPAGTLEKKESPVRCARRELMEEIGYRARSMRKIGEIFPLPGYSTERIMIYKAWDLSPCASTRQKDEIITTSLMDKAKILWHFRRGRIVDAKTICALSLAGLL